MKLRKVDPRKIVIPKIRVTSRFDPETLEMLHASMAASGLIAPIICCEIEVPMPKITADGTEVDQGTSLRMEKKLTLVDGKHRLDEAIALNMPTIDVALVDGDMVDVLTRNLFMDHIRGKHPVTEMVGVIEELHKTYGLDSDQLVAKTGHPREYIENMMLIAELTPMIREALDQGEIKMGHAIQLTRLKDPIRQEECFGNMKVYGMTVAAAKGYITDVLNCMRPAGPLPPPPPPPPPLTFKCAYCDGMFLADQIANPFTCRACSGAMFASMAEVRRIEAKEREADRPTFQEREACDSRDELK